MDWWTILQSGVTGALGPTAAIYAIAAIGLNIQFGYAGLLNFGQVGFMLVGAYGTAISVSTWGLSLWVGILVGMGAAVVLALLLGIPTLRLRGDYLAIATIAAAEVLRFLFRASFSEPVTGGVYGLQQFAGDFYALNPFSDGLTLGPLVLSRQGLWVAVVGWVVAFAAAGLLFLASHAPWGRVIRSIREDELAARSLGKNVYAYKMQALVLGGVLGSLGGALLAINAQAVNADTFMPVITFYLYTIVILGGAARVMGPILGSVIFYFLLTALDTFLRQGVQAGWMPDIVQDSDVGALRFAVVGLGLMLLMLFRPAGMIGNQKEMRLDVR